MDPPSSSENFFVYRQPQFCSLLHTALRPFNLTMLIEQIRQFVGGDALAGVGHGDDQLIVFGGRAHGHATAVSGIDGGTSGSVSTVVS